MDTRKLLGTAVGGLLFVLCILFFTYAWYTWRSSNTILNSTIVDNISSSEIVNLDNDGNILVNDIGPVLSVDDGVITGFSADNKSMEDVTLYMYLNIENIDKNLRDESFKYVIVKSVVSPRTISYNKDSLVYDYDNPIAEGNFLELNIGTHKIGKDIVNSKSINFYKVIFYIDGNMNNNNNLMTNNMKGNLIIQDNSLIDEVLAPNAINDKDIDFSKTSAESNTNGIYVRNETQDNTNPIYYYRGDVDNNLIFADFCWKIVRTTETGGLKLIYNGVSSDDEKCNNTGSSSQIGTKAFNSNRNSPTYIGYMYGTPYTYNSKSLSNTYVYGNDINYNNGTYTLVDTTTQSSYSTTLNNYHYTCFSTGTTCASVSYIYSVDSNTGYYIALSNGKKIEDALSEMLDYNTTSSTIKGNKTTEGTIDYWYYTNIEQKGYSNYIEDTIWCNDRNIYQLNGWNPDEGDLNNYLRFSSHNRAYTYQPDLICSRTTDRFTTNKYNGNGNLTYPAFLLTVDEIILAGGVYNTSNIYYYLYNGNSFYTGSPSSLYHSGPGQFYFDTTGKLRNDLVNTIIGIRPSISLKLGIKILEDGIGTENNPYIIE